MKIAANPLSNTLIPPVLPGQLVPIGIVPDKKNAGTHKFDFEIYLGYARDNLFVIEHLERIWLVGALLTLGDSLAKYKYFDKSPLLELIRHLRNGVAHGNRFKIDDPARLTKYPAHNKDAIAKPTTTYEITPVLQGREVLFDFIDQNDLVNLFYSVGFYLDQLSSGQGNKI